MNKCGSTNLQIEYDCIQMKGMHFFYQDEVVFNDDDIGVALTMLQKWSTQSSMVMIYISQNNLSSLCVHTSSLISGFLLKADHVSLKIKMLETSFLDFKFGKPPKPPKTKFVAKPPLKN